jgi:hypothetical protein
MARLNSHGPFGIGCSRFDLTAFHGTLRPRSEQVEAALPEQISES